MRTSRLARSRGFTLIGLPLVVVLVGVRPMAVATRRAEGRAKQRRVQADFVVLAGAVDLYHLRNDKYPQRMEDLIAAGILDKMPVDPWGNPYRYTPPFAGGKYYFTSFGSDGAPGGTGDMQDLTTNNIEAVLKERP